MSVVQLAPSSIAELQRAARRGYPREVCGLLLGARADGALRITRLLPCPNVAPAAEQERRFEIEPRAVLNVRRALRGSAEEIIGFYHSHPDGQAVPSERDIEYFGLWPDTAWLIVPVQEEGAGAPRAWWVDVNGTSFLRELRIETSARSDDAKTACVE